MDDLVSRRWQGLPVREERRERNQTIDGCHRVGRGHERSGCGAIE